MTYVSILDSTLAERLGILSGAVILHASVPYN